MTKQAAGRWAVIVALWLFVGLVLSIEVYFTVRMSAPEVRFWDVAAGQYQRALLWAVLAPFVIRLKMVVPLAAGRGVGGVLFHFTCSFVIMAVYFLVRILYLMVQAGDPLDQFWPMAQQSFYGRNLIDMAYYWAVLGVAYVLEIREKYQRETLKGAQLESRLIETELRALKHQLKPHFLFNTMNTISVLVREGKNDQAVNLIARLSSLLRTSLESTGIQTVTLRQELDFLTRYLEIQQARFGERLNFRTDTDPASLEAVIPNLILQPIVENAILHGIAQRATPGHVEIIARVREQRLEMQVRDDGPGFEGDPSRRIREGIGLTNTRERLDRLYGKDHQMVLKSEKGRGVTVSLVLPLHTAAASRLHSYASRPNPHPHRR